jgi:methyl-accepting chemotaxis protein
MARRVSSSEEQAEAMIARLRELAAREQETEPEELLDLARCLEDAQNDRVERFGAVLELIQALAGGNLKTRLEPGASGDHLDAVIEGLNMLGEELSHSLAALQSATQEVESLSKLLPLCAWCRKVDLGDQGWTSVEAYFRSQTGREVTHGICPECRNREFSES